MAADVQIDVSKPDVDISLMSSEQALTDFDRQRVIYNGIQRGNPYCASDPCHSSESFLFLLQL